MIDDDARCGGGEVGKNRPCHRHRRNHRLDLFGRSNRRNSFAEPQQKMMMKAETENY